jgi:uncharacterized membrane protein YbhN (UPF0104 family)
MSSAESEPLGWRFRRTLLPWLVRAAISALVLTILFSIVPIGQVWSNARRLPPMLWLFSLGAFLLGHCAAAAKWRLLIGPGVSFAHAFEAHLAGLAANLCLPGLAGGDVVRAGLVYTEAHDKPHLAVGSIADRVLDMFGLMVLAVAGALWSLPQREGVPPALLWVLGASAAALCAVFPVSRILERRLRHAHPAGRVARLAARGIVATAYLVRHPRRLFLCLAISMAVQATFVGINIALAAAVQLDAPVGAWFFAWATAKVIAILPISLGGLGVREAAMSRLLLPFGADPGQVIAIGLIWQTILYASGLIGALAQLAWRPTVDKDAARVAPPAAPVAPPAAVERSP